MSSWIRFIIFLLIVTVVNGHHLKIIIVAVLGLAGLWMVHTLAQDFNKIQNNMQNAGGKSYLVKRSISDLTTNQYYKPQQNFEVDWQMILSRDTTNCARSFVCQLASLPHNKLNHEEKTILNLIRYSIKTTNLANNEINQAVEMGFSTKNPKQCQHQYKPCPYSSKTMMSLLTALSVT